MHTHSNEEPVILTQHTEKEQKETRKEQNEWYFKIILITAISVGAWFAQLIYNGQKELAEKLDLRLRTLEINMAETNGNRFSSKDWANAKLIIDNDKQFAEADRRSIEKRISQVEATTNVIERSLERIESRLGTK